MFVRDEGREDIAGPVWRKEKARIIPEAFHLHEFLLEPSAIGGGVLGTTQARPSHSSSTLRYFKYKAKETAD